MIYGFLSDSMFKVDPLLEYGESSLPPVCYLDDTIENYFNTKLTVTDPRATRIVPEYPGKIKLHVDADQLEEAHLFTLITGTQMELLFGMIETIYTDEIHSETQLNDELVSHPDFGSIYVANSIQRGSEFVSTGIAVGPQTMVDWFQVEVSFGAVTETLKIWMSRAKFASDYPISTISKVILPCDHTYLLNPSGMISVVDALILSNEYSLSALNTDIASSDHSGLLVYKTKYNVSSSSVKMMPFGILYKGAAPSSLDVRKAIREYLISFGTAVAEVWESLLPDLFVTGQFYLIPLWDNVTVRVDRTMFPSILPTKKISVISEKAFPNMDSVHLQEHSEILTCAQSEVFIFAISDPLNADAFTILGEHPTYQYYSPQNQIHAYMEAKTKEFNIRLNRCMAVLSGEAVLEEFIQNTIDGKRYLSFVSGGLEFHVMRKEDYLDLINS